MVRSARSARLEPWGRPRPSRRARFARAPQDEGGVRVIAIQALILTSMTVASAQDIRGLEICTAEKDMARRTSCLQSNVELLQQELTKQTRRATEDRAAAAKEVTAMKGDLSGLKADLAALKTALAKAQDEIAELKKSKPAEKK